MRTKTREHCLSGRRRDPTTIRKQKDQTKMYTLTYTVYMSKLSKCMVISNMYATKAKSPSVFVHYVKYNCNVHVSV